MPLPDPEPVVTHVPADAGVGLRAQFRRQRNERPPADWPPDWWQRNYDQLLEKDQGAEPVPLSGRQLKIPPAPGSLP